MRVSTAVFQCKKGGAAIEYALVASLIAIAAIGGMKTLSNAVATCRTTCEARPVYVSTDSLNRHE